MPDYIKGTIKRIFIKKVYCKNCKHNMTLPKIFMGRIVWDFCFPNANLSFMDNFSPVIGGAKIQRSMAYWMEDQNKDNNCKFYKRVWWKFWVKLGKE